jgi:hypothetical protein
VAEAGPEELDGVTARHFTATLTAAEFESLLSGEDSGGSFDDMGSSEGDELATEEAREWDVRRDAVDRYVADRTSVVADLYLGPDDQLLKMVVSARTDIEDQFEDCWALYTPFEELSITTDFTDLGGEVVIEAPDPSTVLSLEDLLVAFPSTWDDFEDYDEPVLLETVDGARERGAVMNDLEKFGHVIGLVPDPWTLPREERYAAAAPLRDLSDAELVARYNEVDAVLAELPRTSTSIGELTRPELLWNTKWGLETFGGDIAVADGLSDAEIGALIDGYVEHNGGAVGDGVWGDIAPEALDTTDDELSVEEEFEGCPA